ncbi:uncharacterized protein LOC112498676 [Citrus sinensis]|uniref:uncharacterized protein LOC112498676 n=1 Tax=Citrus sinensis TaxID=2711 RepID=UPI000D6270EF|nr:uncharacterized protein LOC112498676 [Citrus sinensis]
MAPIRLLIIAIGFLFLMHGIRDCSFALAQDEATSRNGLGAIDQGHAVSPRKEVADDHGVAGAISMSKLWLQGRKMAVHMVWKEHEKNPKGMDKSGTLKISGKRSAEASKKYLESFDHPQDDDQPAVSLSNPKQMQPRDQENEVSQERPDVDTQRLLIAAKEIENLMQKDYRGMSKPRRKPPINNHEPRH